MRSSSLLGGVAAAAIVVGLLAGCAPTPPIDAEVASRLASAAQQLRTEAAAGSYAEALSQLDALEQEARTASHSDKMSADRSAQVLGSIAQVRADLEALRARQTAQTASPAPAASDEPTSAPSPNRAKGKTKSPQSPTPGPWSEDQ